jgi:hypothetical protein
MGGSSCQSEKTTPSQSRVLDATAAVKMELKCLTEKEHPVSSGELLVVVHACNLSYLGGRGRRISSWRPTLGKASEILLQKQFKKKSPGDTAQVYSTCLASEALGSTPMLHQKPPKVRVNPSFP